MHAAAIARRVLHGPALPAPRLSCRPCCLSRCLSPRREAPPRFSPATALNAVPPLNTHRLGPSCGGAGGRASLGRGSSNSVDAAAAATAAAGSPAVATPAATPAAAPAAMLAASRGADGGTAAAAAAVGGRGGAELLGSCWRESDTAVCNAAASEASASARTTRKAHGKHGAAV
eukprot:237674-Chlamydomonas_euryale.AAC.2